MRPPGIIAGEAPPLGKSFGINAVKFSLSNDLREGKKSTPGRSGAPARELASEWAGVGFLLDTDGKAGRSPEFRSRASFGSVRDRSARRSARPDGVGQAGRGRLSPEWPMTVPTVDVVGPEDWQRDLRLRCFVPNRLCWPIGQGRRE